MKNIGNNTVQIEALNSFGLGRRLYNEHAGKLFYVEEKNYWLVWNGKQFICSKIKVEQMARELIESTIRKELDISHRDKITDTYKNNITHEDILKFIDNITGIFGIQSTLAGGRLIPELTTSDSEFDTHFDFLNTPNGVVNLKTGELLAHNPEYKFTKITRTEYHPEAKSEKFETFLNKITNNNSELIEYLQRIMGYALTGSTKEQIFFIFCGDGANGKSTFFNLFKSVLGLYAQSTPAQTLLATRGSKPKTAEFQNLNINR
jgi:putative DNA primase/helicase